MKKLLLLAVSMLLTSSLFAQYYIAGDGSATNGWCCGYSWKINGCSLDGSGNSKSFNLKPGTFNFKVTDGVSIWMGYEKLNTSASTAGTVNSGGNIQFTLAADATVTVSYDDVADQIVITSTTPFGPLSITSWTLVGPSPWLDADWDPEATQNDLSFVGGVYQITKYDVELAADGVYEYKFAANHSWAVKTFPALGNDSFEVDKDGVYDLYFGLNPVTEEWEVQKTLKTTANEAQADAPEVVGVFNMIGQPISAETPGLKIFVYSDGTTEKKF